ncbi:hypothetical protein C8R46DRAFT_901030 [Mycena filopes]|nr:hypothetical protein C8R46DRAFT_901030 [Mycena filopes]
MSAQIDLLNEHHAVAPAFPGSIFTTAEFTFGNSCIHNRRNVRDVLHGLRAITVLGNYSICVCVLPSDDIVMRCPPGTTILIEGSVKDYFFSRVGKGETHFLFQQYFDASVQRWIDRGFRSDAEYDAKATPEEIAYVEEKQANRVPFTMKLLSRLHELHA